MGILDDAIREHLDLKRKHGARDAELREIEDEAFGGGEQPDAFTAGEVYGQVASPEAGSSSVAMDSSTAVPDLSTEPPDMGNEEPTRLVEPDALRPTEPPSEPERPSAPEPPTTDEPRTAGEPEASEPPSTIPGQVELP